MKSSKDDKQVEFEDFTKADDLMGSLTYGVRSFCISGDWENPLLGVMLDETVDSALVAMPVKFIMIGGKRAAKIVDSGLYIRLMKSSITSIAFPTEPLNTMYLDIMVPSALKVFPDLLDIIDLGPFHETFDDPENSLDDNEDDSPEVAEIVNSGIDHASMAPVVSQNMSENEIDEAIKKAIDGGFFIPPNNKLTH